MATKFTVMKEVPHHRKRLDPYPKIIGKSWEPIPKGNLFLKEVPIEEAGKEVVLGHLLKENHLIPGTYRLQCAGILGYKGVMPHQIFKITSGDIREFKNPKLTYSPP